MEEVPENNGFVDNEDDELNIDEEFEEEEEFNNDNDLVSE
jgi:hypothetical protein